MKISQNPRATVQATVQRMELRVGVEVGEVGKGVGSKEPEATALSSVRADVQALGLRRERMQARFGWGCLGGRTDLCHIVGLGCQENARRSISQAGSETDGVGRVPDTGLWGGLGEVSCCVCVCVRSQTLVCTHMQMIWGRAESLPERSNRAVGRKRQRHAKS